MRYTNWITYDELVKSAFSTSTPNEIAKQHQSMLKRLKEWIPDGVCRRKSLNRNKCIAIKQDGTVAYSEVRV